MLPDPVVPPDNVLLARVELAFPQMSRLDREVFAHARLRLLAGHSLKPAQRRHLHRLLTLVHRLEETR
jgi:hypothetical protein